MFITRANFWSKMLCCRIINSIRFCNNLNGSLSLRFHHVTRAASTRPDGPSVELQRRIDAFELHPDPHQTAVISALQSLYEQVQSYQPPAKADTGSGFFGLFTKKPKLVKGLKGLYIHGSVGGGKSTLMDLFYDCCKVDKRERVHFNAFMTRTHSMIHAVKNKESFRRAEGDTKPIAFDPTAPVAQMILDKTWLICFDEFQVSNMHKCI